MAVSANHEASRQQENEVQNSRPLALAEPDIENNFPSSCTSYNSSRFPLPLTEINEESLLNIDYSDLESHLEVPLMCTDPESRDLILDDNNILIQCDTVLKRLNVIVENEAKNVPWSNENEDTLETSAAQEKSTSVINVPEKSNNEKSDSISKPYNSEEDDNNYLPESSSEESDSAEDEGIIINNEDREEIKENRSRNRKAKPGQWKRNETKKNRMEGKNYTGYTRSRLGVIKSGIPRQARKIGPTCESKMCYK